MPKPMRTKPVTAAQVRAYAGKADAVERAHELRAASLGNVARERQGLLLLVDGAVTDTAVAAYLVHVQHRGALDRDERRDHHLYARQRSDLAARPAERSSANPGSPLPATATGPVASTRPLADSVDTTSTSATGRAAAAITRARVIPASTPQSRAGV